MLEFTLVVIIFSVLVAVAFERIAATRTRMERARIEHVVGAMRSTLALEFARRHVAGGDAPPPADLVGSNVFRLMDPPPAGYEAAVTFADWSAAPPGTWFYDADRRAVVYRAHDPSALPPPRSGPAGAWKAVAQGPDGGGDGRVEPAREPLSGVGLVRLHEGAASMEKPR